MGVKNRDLQRLIDEVCAELPKIPIEETIDMIDEDSKKGELAAFIKENYTLDEIKEGLPKILKIIERRSKGFMQTYE